MCVCVCLIVGRHSKGVFDTNVCVCVCARVCLNSKGIQKEANHCWGGRKFGAKLTLTSAETERLFGQASKVPFDAWVAQSPIRFVPSIPND